MGLDESISPNQYKIIHCDRHGDRTELLFVITCCEEHAKDFSLAKTWGIRILMPGAQSANRFG
jgi:hypothetical protein